MRKLTLTLMAFLLCYGVDAQSVKRQSIGTMGSTYHGEGITIQQSVGQPYQTGAYYSNQVESRPGFIQPTDYAVEFISSTFEVQVDVYPNPAVHTISFNLSENLENVQLYVYDQTGSVLFTAQVEDLRSYQYDCSTLANGTYYIAIKDGTDNYNSKLIITK